jgi:magnesium transporter
MEIQALAESVRETLATHDASGLRTLLEDVHPADLALVLAELEPRDMWRALSALPPDERAETFGYLPTEQQVDLARTLTRKQLADIVFHMSADERADLFNRLSQEQQEALLPGLAQAERDDIRRLAGYEEGTAGAIMTSDYATLAPQLTAREAIEWLRREAPDKETIYQSYVIDADRRLLGAVSLRDLILAPSARRVEELMVREVIFARVEDEQEDVAGMISKYDLLALPIINGGEKLVGIVTYDDAMDVVEQEATEDFHKAASVDHLETSVRDAGFRLLYRKRVFWLVLLVFGNLFSGAGIAYFEDTIAAYVALVFFLPLLVGSSGNAGSQAATLMVRALATGDVELRDWGRMLGRELLVAGALGLTMAIAISGVGVIRGGSEIAAVVAITMVTVVIIGSLIGMSLPFVLNRFRFDPATASAPLVATIADAVGVLVYFGVASAVLQLPPS